MNTLAVLIAGELRTWSKCAPYLFRFFDYQSKHIKQIDYFFVTWDKSHDMPDKTITLNDVTDAFRLHGKNLVGSIVIPTIGRKSSTFYNQAFLAKVVNVLKRENEIRQKFIYDQVVETRPDIYMRSAGIPWTAMKDYEVCNCNSYDKSPQGFNTIDDVYYRTNSFTNDILANRYWYRKQNNSYVHTGKDHSDNIEIWHNHHCMIAEYLTLNGIEFVRRADTADYLGPHIAVRRSAIDVDFDDGNIEELKLKYQPYDQHSWQQPDTRLINWH